MFKTMISNAGKFLLKEMTFRIWIGDLFTFSIYLNYWISHLKCIHRLKKATPLYWDLYVFTLLQWLEILFSICFTFYCFTLLYIQTFISTSKYPKTKYPVSLGCRIDRQLLCREIRQPQPQPNECPGYDTKQSNGEDPVMLKLLRIQSTSLLPSLPGPLWPGVVAHYKGPIYG